MKALEPYVIRGHHLEEYAEMISAQLAPEQAARFFRLKVTDNPDREYVADVVGEDPVTIARTEANLTEAFDRFANLDSQDPVRITSGEKDAICACCPIGRHCAAGRIHRLEIGSVTKKLSFIDIADMRGIARFKAIAKNIGRQGLVEVTLARDVGYDEGLTGWAHADGYPEAIEYEDPLTTTADVVRLVLSQWDRGDSVQAT